MWLSAYNLTSVGLSLHMYKVLWAVGKINETMGVKYLAQGQAHCQPQNIGNKYNNGLSLWFCTALFIAVVLLWYQVLSNLWAFAFAPPVLGTLLPRALHRCSLLNLSFLKSGGISSQGPWLIWIFLVKAATPHLPTTLALHPPATKPCLVHDLIVTETILFTFENWWWSTPVRCKLLKGGTFSVFFTVTFQSPGQTMGLCGFYAYCWTDSLRLWVAYLRIHSLMPWMLLRVQHY